MIIYLENQQPTLDSEKVVKVAEENSKSGKDDLSVDVHEDENNEDDDDEDEFNRESFGTSENQISGAVKRDLAKVGKDLDGNDDEDKLDDIEDEEVEDESAGTEVSEVIDDDSKVDDDNVGKFGKHIDD